MKSCGLFFWLSYSEKMIRSFKTHIANIVETDDLAMQGTRVSTSVFSALTYPARNVPLLVWKWFTIVGIEQHINIHQRKMTKLVAHYLNQCSRDSEMANGITGDQWVNSVSRFQSTTNNLITSDFFYIHRYNSENHQLICHVTECDIAYIFQVSWGQTKNSSGFFNDWFQNIFLWFANWHESKFLTGSDTTSQQGSFWVWAQPMGGYLTM